MSTAHLNDPGEVGENGEQPQAKTKKDWRKFRKYFLAAGLILAAALAWWLWPSKMDPVAPAPEVTVPDETPAAPTPTPAPSPAPATPPPVVATPDPVPAPLPAAATPVEAKISDVEKIIGGKRNNCSVLEIGGKVIRETCFPTE